MTHPRLTAAAACLLLAGPMAACGAIEDLIPQENEFAQSSAKEIFAAAKQDIESLKSVHVSGSVRDEGTPGQMNLSVSRSGDCHGDLTVAGMSFDLLVADKRVFIRPDAAFFRRSGQTRAQADQSVAALGGRWIEDTSKDFGEVCDLEELFDVSDQGIKNLRKALPGKVTVTGEAQLLGIAVVGLSSTGPKGSFTMNVAVEEPHHVISLTASGTGKTDGGLTYSAHDFPVDTEVPAKADIVRMPTRG
jgi:hypothetical protein